MSLYGGHTRPLALVQITTLNANMATLDNIKGLLTYIIKKKSQFL